MRARKIWVLASIFLLVTAGWAGAKTVDFNLAQSGAVLSGYWQETTSGGRVSIGGSNGSQLDATVVGKVVVLTCYSTAASNITVTVDGKTYMPTFFKLHEWTTLTISLGSPGSHSLTIKQPFLGAAFFLDTGAGVVNGPTFSVRGKAPAMGPPAGFGPQYQLSDPVNVTPFIQAEGGLTQTVAGGYPSVYYGGPGSFSDQALYFTASATGAIKAWMYGAGSLVSLYQDGVKIGEVATPDSGSFQWVTLFTGDGTTHRYGIASAFARSGAFYLWSLMTVDGTLSQVALLPRPRFIAYGDNIVLGLAGTDEDSSQGFVQRLGVSLGWAVYNRGVASSTVYAFGGGEPAFTTEAGEARTADVTGNADGARGVVVLYGINDVVQAGGPESVAQFQTAYQSMLSKIAGGVSASCPIVCIGILPRLGMDPDDIAPWNAAIEAAIAAVGAGNVRYADPTGWGLLQNNGPAVNYTDPNGNTEDGENPNSKGCGIILNNLTPFFAPPGVPAITSAASGSAPIGESLEYQTTASNLPLTFSATGLPPGLALNAATGTISGTPTVSGTFPISLTATNAAGTGMSSLELTIVRPIVTAAATVAETTVNSGRDGEITLTISTVRRTNLKIDYTVTGSAVPGKDFVALSGVAVIQAGETQKVLQIRPLGMLDGASSKTVKLRLAPGQDYAVGGKASAKVKILAAP